MKRTQIIAYIVTILVVACVSSLCTAAIVNNNVNERIYDAVKSEKEHYQNFCSGIDTFLEVKNYVDNTFVGDIDYDKLDGLLADSYVELLEDKYSAYYTKEELDEYLSSLSGNFVGIGITCTNKDGKIHIESVMDNSPAKEAGLLAGENIVSVDGIKVTEDSYDEATDAVRGVEGTFVELEVESASGAVRKISVERRKIDTETVYSEMLEGDIAYIRITQFAINTSEKFISAVDSMLKDGAKGFIFDVRNNPGGELNCVVNVLDRLLPEGPIVNIVDGAGNVETKYSTNDKRLNLPMTVLTNGGTASAAELFAAALRDYEVASLYGTVTYGKGYMQRIVSLSDGSGLRLSIAKYNPPYGENYETIGVSPHVTVEDDASTEKDEQLEEAKKYFVNK